MNSEPINSVVMLHAGGAHLAAHYAPVWRSTGGECIALANRDVPANLLEWADSVERWPEDPGHHGPGQIGRHARAAAIAAELPGPTAILEDDCFVAHPFEVAPDTLYGSRLWDAKNELGNGGGHVCRHFVHPPYVARREAWIRIAEILAWWASGPGAHEGGQSDRVLSMAAQLAGCRIAGVGFSRNTVRRADIPDLAGALRDRLPLIHGVKSAEPVRWWLEERGFAEARDLWEQFGLSRDTRQPPWAIDMRHAVALRALVEELRPEVIVEIGSHRGHSTAAILKAMERCPCDLFLVEPNPTPELLNAINASRHVGRVRIHRRNSWQLESLPPDLVFIDGDHTWPALADLAWALARGANCIVLHDVRSDSEGIGGCWGAQLAADILRRADGRHWLQDTERREGEWTHRGLGVSLSCTSPNALRILTKIAAVISCHPAEK